MPIHRVNLQSREVLRPRLRLLTLISSVHPSLTQGQDTVSWGGKTRKEALTAVTTNTRHVGMSRTQYTQPHYIYRVRDSI
jgi:hypothetical protein